MSLDYLFRGDMEALSAMFINIPGTSTVPQKLQVSHYDLLKVGRKEGKKEKRKEQMNERTNELKVVQVK